MLLWQVYIVVVYISLLLHRAGGTLICHSRRPEILNDLLDLPMVIYASLESSHGVRNDYASCLGINSWPELLPLQVSLDVSILWVAESNIFGLCVVAVLVSLLFVDLPIRQISSEVQSLCVGIGVRELWPW